MHNAGVIALPTQQSISLRPELWLALGVASYNHQLLTKEPLRVISRGKSSQKNSPRKK